MVPKVAKKMRFGAIIIYNGAESGKKIEIRRWYNSGAEVPTACRRTRRFLVPVSGSGHILFDVADAMFV